MQPREGIGQPDAFDFSWDTNPSSQSSQQLQQLQQLQQQHQHHQQQQHHVSEFSFTNPSSHSIPHIQQQQQHQSSVQQHNSNVWEVVTTSQSSVGLTAQTSTGQTSTAQTSTDVLSKKSAKEVKIGGVKDKIELNGASTVVVNRPPILCSSPDGWKAACLTLCKTAYIRNNKRAGLKNLRCFPHCLSLGHHPLGFCGSCVYTRVWLPSNISTSR